MRLAFVNPTPAAPRDPNYLTVQEAAEMLGCNAGHLRRLCADKYEPEGLAYKDGGEWIISRAVDARLRNDRDRANRDNAQIAELRKAGVRKKHLEIALARREIVLGFTAFRLKYSNKSPREARQLYVGHLIAERMIGDGKLIKKISVSRLYEWQSLYAPRRTGDGEGGLAALVPQYNSGGGGGGDSIGPAAWECFLNFKHNGHAVSAREAYRLTRGVQLTEHRDDDDWRWPSYRTVLTAYEQRVPIPERIYNEEGPHKFRAKCLPKITRSLEDVPAGAIFSGDERIFDFMCRMSKGDGTWKRVRPKVTAWMDVRSRMFVGWYIGESANSDTILSSFRMACEIAGTLPDEVNIDNGRDYRSVAGRSRSGCRKWEEYDAKRIQTAFERLEIVAQYAKVRHPWSKPIESRFHAVKERFDKHFASFWGGAPHERPWDADRWTRENIERLPTIDDVRAAFDAFLVGLHEEVLIGDGMFGRAPRQALRDFFLDNPRPASPELLEYACCQMRGPIKVGRGGAVRVDNVYYGKHDKDVWRLIGREVWVLVDAVQADRVTLCNEDGTLICVAYADNNLGETRDELRAAERMKRQAERDVRKYPEARARLMRTTQQQIAKNRTAAAKAEQTVQDAEEAKQPQSVRLVRPDIAASVGNVKRAAGAEAMRRLTLSNEAAGGINAQRPRRIDFADMPGPPPPEAPRPRRRIDFADMEAPPPPEAPRPRRHVDFANMQATPPEGGEETEQRQPRVVDFARMAADGEKSDGTG